MCFPKNFFCFRNLDALCRPVAGKPETVGAGGFVFEHGHFCGVCPIC